MITALVTAIGPAIAAKLSGAWLKLAAVLAGVAGSFLLALELMALGARRERAAEQNRVAVAAQARKAKEDEINRLSDGAVDQRLARWVRKGPPDE